MKLTKMLFAALIAVMLVMASLAFAEKTGWVDNGNSRYLYSSNGKKVTGWYQEGNDWYYMNNEGRMAKGWFRLTSGIYHAADDGKIDEGWQRFQGIWYTLRQVNVGTEESPLKILRWYYVDGSEEMPFGKRELAGQIYKVENTKMPLSGWQEQDGAKAYFNENGTADVGWIEVENEYFYLDVTARVAHGNKFIDGEYFALSGKGKLQDEVKIAEIEEKISVINEPAVNIEANTVHEENKTEVHESTPLSSNEESSVAGENTAEEKKADQVDTKEDPSKNQEPASVEVVAVKADAETEGTSEIKPVNKEETKAEDVITVNTNVEAKETIENTPANKPQETKPVEIIVVKTDVEPNETTEDMTDNKQDTKPAETTDNKQDTKPAETTDTKTNTVPTEQNNTAASDVENEKPADKQPEPVVPVVTTKTETTEEEIPFNTEYQNDDTRFPEDGNKTIQAGKNGKKTISYSVTYTDGEETAREKTGETVTIAAVNEIISVPCKGHKVEVKEESEEEEIAFETETQEDSSRIKGDADKVIQEGEKGVRTYVYSVTYTDGKETDRALKSDLITKQPVNQIVSVATGEKPTYTVTTVTETEEIPYTSEEMETDLMYKGTKDVAQEGRNGTKEVTYEVTTDSDGNQISKTVVSEKVTKVMKPEIVTVGTFVPTYTTSVVPIDLPGMHGTRSSSLDADCVTWAQTMANNCKVEHSGPIGRESVGGWGSASAAASGVAKHGGTVIAWSEYWGAGCVSLTETLPGGGTNTVYFACARASGAFLEGAPIQGDD